MLGIALSTLRVFQSSQQRWEIEVLIPISPRGEETEA